MIIDLLRNQGIFLPKCSNWISSFGTKQCFSRHGHSLHCARVSSGLRSSCVTKFNVTLYCIGSKIQQNSPCPGKQVKECMRSMPPFDMVCLELFSGFRGGGNSWTHTPCLYPLAALWQLFTQRTMPAACTSVCDLTSWSEPAMVSSWMEDLQAK